MGMGKVEPGPGKGYRLELNRMAANDSAIDSGISESSRRKS